MSTQSASMCPFSSLSARRPRTLAGAAALAFGLVSYAAFFVSFNYTIGFLGNWIVPKSIDSGPAGSVPEAMLINAALLIVFVLQHTIMARPAFKAWWTRFVPHSIERSVFVLLASASLALMFWLWRPMPQVVWSLDHPAAVWGLNGLSLLGYAIALASSCMVSHFELFGLRQVWLRWKGRPQTPVGFRLFGLYRLVRHPLMMGLLIWFWATPHMTVGHLFFAVMTTGYIFMGTWFEERDLVAEHGEKYLAYRRAVRGLIPLPKGSVREAEAVMMGAAASSAVAAQGGR